MDDLEKYITGTGQKLGVHQKENCTGTNCVIHNPSNHLMINFPTYWRDDRYLMERICSHGIGHPDPDDLKFKENSMREQGMTEEAIKKLMHYESIHGCDGCCSNE